MPKRARWRRDGTSPRPKMIDLRLAGLDGKGDRLQVPSGTVHRTAYELRVNAIREAWAVGGVWADAVRALHARRFDVNAFVDARARGLAGVQELLERAGSEPLRGLVDDYLAQTDAKDVAKMRQRLDRFLGYLGDAPTVAALTTANVDAFLSSLVDLRTVSRAPAESDAKEAKQPTAAKGSTVNRYRAVIGGLSTWAIRVGRLQVHPIAGKKVKKRAEPHHRTPEMSPDEYRDYTAAIGRDRPDLLVIFLLLLHTGADVGEVFTRTARDVDLERKTPRMRYQRTKTERFAASRPRFVPMPPNVVAELRAHIAEHQLRGSELLFSMLARRDVELTHERAARAIKRDELTLKDLRHIAAIAWARAGVGPRLIARYLGHTSLAMVMRYTDYEPDAETEAEIIERAASTLTRTIGVTPLRPQFDRAAGDSSVYS